MGNLKTVALVLLGSLAVVGLMVFGLSKLGDGGVVKSVDKTKLLDGARYVFGNNNAKVTVVEFSDVQCPACKDAFSISKQLMGMGDVQFVYRHFPLVTIHQNAWKAARAVEAANLMGKGFEMMDVMFQHQGEWASSPKFEELVVGYAKGLGLDENQFKTNWNDDKTDKLVKVDSDLAAELQLQGTPTYFVNGEQAASTFVLDKVKSLLK